MQKKIKVEQLCLGMHIHELCGSWMSHPFWRTRFVLKDPDDLRRLRESGIKEVWIDSAKGLDVEEGERREQVTAAVERVLNQASNRIELPKQVTLSEEVKQAAKTCAKATDDSHSEGVLFHPNQDLQQAGNRRSVTPRHFGKDRGYRRSR